MRSSRDLLYAALAVLALGCTSDIDDGANPQVAEATSLADRPCPDDSIVSYENFGGPFITTWCNGCHSSLLAPEMRQNATVGVDFDNLDMIKAHAARIWIRAGDGNDTMPPAGDPDEVERELLGEWLACGAPTDAELGM